MVRSSRFARLAVFIASVAVVSWIGVIGAGCGSSSTSGGGGGSGDASLPPCDSCSNAGEGIDPSSLPDAPDPRFYDGALFSADAASDDDASDATDNDASDSAI